MTATNDGSGAGRPLPKQFGRYRVERLLARGGMGAVYLVTNTALGRQEALKVPDFDAGAGAVLRERFLREAKAAAGLDHPNLCPVYDVGERDGVCYLTMRYLKGKLLSEFTGAPQPPRKAVEIVTKLAQALAAAHARGIIHRDLKPGNVMMCPGVGPVVMDFGLAKQTQGQGRKLTRMGSILGTPAYMPPEQVKGDLAKLGPASDVYSLGVILFELLTGRPPFEGATEEEVFRQVLCTAAPAASALRPGLSPALDAVCRQALAKAPEQRQASMKALAAELIAYLKATPPTEGAGNLTATKAGPADVFQMPTVVPGRATPPVRGSEIRAAPTMMGIPAPPSIRKSVGAPAGARSLRALLGWSVGGVLIIGGLVGLAVLVYAWNQNKAVAPPTVAVAPPPAPSPIPLAGPPPAPSPAAAPAPPAPFLLPAPAPPAAVEPEIYPAPEQQHVPLSFCHPEIPDPIPEDKGKRAGYPVTATFPRDITVAKVEARLVLQTSQQEVEVWFSTPEQPAAPGYQKNTICLIAKKPLQPDSTYQVSMNALVNGERWSQKWSFTTENEQTTSDGAEARALGKLNAYRQAVGLSPLGLDPDLCAACRAHAAYLLLNEEQLLIRKQGWNDEDPALPGYSARGQKAARLSASASNFFDPAAPLDDWMATLVVRIALLDRRMSQVGFACVPNRGRGWITILAYGPIANSNRDESTLFPGKDQQDVPLAYYGHEGPRPIPDDAGGACPITVTFPAGATVKNTVAKVVEKESGEEVDSWLIAPDDPKFKTYLNNSVAVIAKEPFQSKSEYAVTVTADVGGKPWTRTWSFRTLDMEAIVVAKVNAYRKAANLGPVTLDAVASGACERHAKYLTKHSRDAEPALLKVHEEDPKAPEYSAEGAKAADQSVITSGHEPTRAVDAFVATLFHRIGLLDPGLTQVGFGYAKGGRFGWECVLDVGGEAKGEP